MKHLRSTLPVSVAILSMTLGCLPGCVPLVVGGAAMGGAMVATDRRTSGTQLEDKTIELKAANRIAAALGNRGHINVTSYNRIVLLTGEVPTEADSTAVEQATVQVENVKSVINGLGIGFSSSISMRAHDALIANKVRAALLQAKDLVSNAFKVVVERGNVYLMGRVTAREADRATDIARGVSQVVKVVRVFEMIEEADLAAMPAPTRPTPPTTAPRPAE